MRVVPLAALSAAFFCPTLLFSAQTVASATTTPDLSQEPIILRDAGVVLQYRADGTGTRTESQSFTLQSDGAVRTFSVVGVAFAAATQKAEFLYVRVRHPDNSVVETPLNDVQEQPSPVPRAAPVYSDLKQLQLPVRGLRVGDTVEWQTRTTFTTPEIENQYWGGVTLVRDLVTQHQTVELRLPAPAAAKVWTNPQNHLAPQHTQEGGESVYRWQWSSLHPTVGKVAETEKKARMGKLLTPDEETDETEGHLPDIAFTTFADWPAVGAWYRSLEVDRMQPDVTVRAKVAEITGKAATREAKVRAAYDWVATNIRYVGVGFGIGRFQPHSAATVLENQYGDCKDKHTLLAAMLLALGEQPDAVLIGSGVRFNAAVPSPASFNHLITRLTLDGKPVWLDTTAEVAPFQDLIPTLRDKQALVIPPTGAATVQRTPAAPPFPQYATMDVKGKLDKDLTSDSEVTLTFRDDDELVLRAALRQVSPAQYPELVQNIMGGMGFGGTVSDPVVEHGNDLEQPLVLRFHYRRVRNPEWGENRVTALFTPSMLSTVDAKEPPNGSIRLGTPRVVTSTLEMQVPPGWSAELPEAVHKQMPQVRMDTTYHLEGSVIHAERKLTVLSDRIPAADWKAYDAWYTDTDAGSVPYLTLISPGTLSAKASVKDGIPDTEAAETKPVAAPKTEVERLAEATRLVDAANAKLQKEDVDGAERDLIAARELNPNHRDLWGDLGAIAFRRGNRTEAMKLYQKEVELHPESDFAWRNMLSIHSRENFKLAEQDARGWVSASPRQLEAQVALVQTLCLSGQNGPALAAAKAATSALPSEVGESGPWQLTLGQAQLRAGDRAAGIQTLSHVAETDRSPVLRNNAVYELSKIHEQLPFAERMQREVVRQLDEQTASWTGDESPSTLLSTTSVLTAAWDTLGWILFEEGKPVDAEPYVRAAWMNRPNAEIGEHLGDILIALHRQKEASAQYQMSEYLATRTQTGASAALSRKSTESRDKGKLPLLTSEECEQALRDLREFPAGMLPGLSGTTEYRLLFTRQGVKRAKPLRNDTIAAQDKLVEQVKLAVLFPPGDTAALVRQAFLDCRQAVCKLQMLP